MDKHSILVVEDEHTLRRLLQYRLSKKYNVKTASNGEAAVEAIGEHIPDLIISDIMMPRMDGFALQQALQKDPITRAIPFIFLTAKADEKSRLRGMRTGVDDYITKPFDIEQLLSRVERLLERTKLFQSQLDARLGQDFSQRLMPKSLPDVSNYRFFYHNTPREQGGGDLFDWTLLDDGTYLFTIGDVMGKGVQAKFYAFSFLSYIRGTLHAMLRSLHSPAHLLERLNQVLMKDEVMEETFASLLLMQWNPKTHEVTYANAGHCHPILITPTETKLIEYSDLILGLEPSTKFNDTTFTLPPGSALLTFTDGLIEQVMPSGAMLGEPGVVARTDNLLRQEAPIQHLLDRVLNDSRAESFGDDILVFWLERQR